MADLYKHDLNLLHEHNGEESARREAVAQITAAVLWFEQTYGVRKTCGFIEHIADELIAVDAPR